MLLPQNFDVIIIGAGASGLMCALTAGRRKRKVLVIDHAKSAGTKILISGGGRCNFTNLHLSAENYLSKNSHFCKSALNRFTPHDFISFMDRHHISYRERSWGQLFCQGKAREIVDMLLKECRNNKVTIQTETSVKKIIHQEVFSIHTSSGDYTCPSLVIATGGTAMPELGATALGYTIAKQFGLKIIPPKPALVPLTLPSKILKEMGNLAGISVESVVSYQKQSFQEAILFTHKGLSGPAILQISNYWQHREPITINLLPKHDLKILMQGWLKKYPNNTLANLLAQYLPKRLVQSRLETLRLNKLMKQYNSKEINILVQSFHQWKLTPAGTEGLHKAEVTAGGLSTQHLSSKTFEVNSVKGLYFIGEVLDVTGWLGGFNLHWAWASGYCCGQYV